MKWKARAPLQRLLEEMVALLSEDDLALLREELAAGTPASAAAFLQRVRSTAFGFLELSRSSRAKLCQKLQGPERARLVYSAAAWSARALVLLEMLEAHGGEPDDPPRWALPSVLRAVEAFEAEPVWLWPFLGDPPWPIEEPE